MQERNSKPEIGWPMAAENWPAMMSVSSVERPGEGGGRPEMSRSTGPRHCPRTETGTDPVAAGADFIIVQVKLVFIGFLFGKFTIFHNL
jgi:hypothetical protein